MESLERFERDDVYAEVRIDRTLETASLYIAGGGAADADFRPQAAIKAGGEIALGRSANGVRLLMDGDVSRFATGDVYAMKLGFAQYSAARALGYDARAIAVSEAGGPILVGYVLQARAPLTRRASLRTGFADAPETSEGVVVRVRGVNVGLLVDATERWLLRVDGVFEDRGAYTRSEIAVSAARRF